MREREEDIQRQPAERVGGIELLGDGHKADAMLLEDFDDPGEVEQRPLSRSTLYTTTQSTSPARMSASSRCSAGRSSLPPVKPPSS